MRIVNPYNLAACAECEQLASRSGFVADESGPGQYIGIGGLQIPVQLPTVPVQTEVSLSPQIKTVLWVGGALVAAKMFKLF